VQPYGHSTTEGKMNSRKEKKRRVGETSGGTMAKKVRDMMQKAVTAGRLK